MSIQVKQFDEEKLAMYMKSSKEELAKMLIEANKVIDAAYSEINRTIRLE